MKADSNGVFRELEPPAGGAERFRRRLEETAHPWHTVHLRLVAATSIAAVAATLLAIFAIVRDASDPTAETDPERTANIYDAPEFDRLLGRQLGTSGLTVSLNEQPVSLVEMETENHKIRIYRID